MTTRLSRYTSAMRSCKLCGKPLPRSRRLWCSDACRNEWYENHLWFWAAPAALKRALYKCEQCLSTYPLEVHHKEKLELTDNRWNTPKNNQANLIVLCCPCHEGVHHPPKPSDYERTLRAGQLPLAKP